jgi:hypothetical protein
MELPKPITVFKEGEVGVEFSEFFTKKSVLKTNSASNWLYVYFRNAPYGGEQYW